VSTANLLLNHVLNRSRGPETFVLVLDGEGLEQLPDRLDSGGAQYAVQRVTSELGLRHLLWKAKGAPLIAVLPEEVARKIQAAPDVVRRAKDQRVHALAINDVLELVLGVRVIGADAPHLQQLALDHLERISKLLHKRTLPTVIDRQLLTELLVDVSVGEQVRTRTPAQLLAAWVQAPPDWSNDVSLLVRDALPRLHGDEGRLLAWALAAPEQRLRELVIVGAVLTVDSVELPKPAWGLLWAAAAEAPLELDRRILRRVLSELAGETLSVLGDAGASLLSQADRRGRENLTPSQLQTSRVLPLAFSDRCHQLAAQAAEGKPIRAAEIAWLHSHGAAKLNKSDLGVIEALARVSRALDQPLALQQDIVEQVKEYQRHGAFLDLAMTQLRRALSSSAHFHAESQQVLARARERRDRQNLHFATTLAADYEAALHAEGVIPLHRLWKRVVAPTWSSSAKEKLFVIVLDGCSYPVFLELLEALGQDATFPVGLSADREGRVIGLQGLSPLPTVTSHARGSIFLGQLPQDPLVAETVFRDQDEAKTDPARFKQNDALVSRTRRLFLKRDLADGGQALLSALADEDLEVVATVFNAVDDQIGSANTGTAWRPSPEDIAGFKPALHRALRSGRKVLVTADHGHSPWVDKTLRAGAGQTPRYLTLGPGERAPEGFLEIDVKSLGGPPARRAFAWKMGAYLGGPQVGFHGGCSLEEMVVPMGWLVRDGLQPDEPAWWFGGGSLAVPVLASPKPVLPPLVTPTPNVTPPRPQMSLFDPADKAAGLPVPAEALAKLSNDEKAVLVLLRENGSARASELAKLLKKNPGRLNGLMHSLRRSLHERGLVLFGSETLPDGETMYRYRDKDPR